MNELSDVEVVLGPCTRTLPEKKIKVQERASNISIVSTCNFASARRKNQSQQTHFFFPFSRSSFHPKPRKMFMPGKCFLK